MDDCWLEMRLPIHQPLSPDSRAHGAVMHDSQWHFVVFFGNDKKWPLAALGNQHYQLCCGGVYLGQKKALLLEPMVLPSNIGQQCLATDVEVPTRADHTIVVECEVAI